MNKSKQLILSFSLAVLALGFAPMSRTSATPMPKATQANADAKAATKAVVTVTAYDAEGRVLRQGTGVFVSSDGTCVTAYNVLSGASRADVTDVKGTRYAVHRILGANSMYDLVKFSVEGAKKVSAVATSADANTLVGHSLTIVGIEGKKAFTMPVVVTKADPYNKHFYYGISANASEKIQSAPLVDTQGTLVAFVQNSAKASDTQTFAIDARFIDELEISPTGGLNADLRGIGIAKAIPAGEKDALTYIYMMMGGDSITALSALNDFIDAFPENAEGYVNRGKFFATHGEYSRCDAEFARAQQLAGNAASTVKADEVHHELSSLIFQKSVYNASAPAAGWDLSRAASEANAAFALNPLPFYLLQEGRCLFADKKFAEAYDKFVELTRRGAAAGPAAWSEVAESEAFFYAARALEKSGGEDAAVIALLDSAVLYAKAAGDTYAATYYLERAQRLNRAQEFRRAVADLNEYEKIIGPKNLTAQFYIFREQIEVQCRMFQQALDDIQSALTRQPGNIDLLIEEAAITLRGGLYDDAIQLCNARLKAYPEEPNFYRIMGIAYGELGKKAQARTALLKAKDLGDDSIDEVLERYK